MKIIPTRNFDFPGVGSFEKGKEYRINKAVYDKIKAFVRVVEKEPEPVEVEEPIVDFDSD